MSKSEKKNTGKKKDRQSEVTAGHYENTGNHLRTLRIGKGLSIKDVTEATRISEVNLNAIEDQDYSSLPATTFTKGLVNIYARYLGADADAVVLSFMEEREAHTSQKRRLKTKSPREIMTPKRLAEPSHISSMTMAGILFLIIAATFTAYCIYTSWNPFSFMFDEADDLQSAMNNVFTDEQSAAVHPSQDQIIIVPAGKPSQEAAPASPDLQEKQEAAPESPNAPSAQESEGSQSDPGEQPAVQNYTIEVRFLKDTSLELRKDEEDSFVAEFTAGDVRSWSDGTVFRLTFSEPDSAEILVNDTPIPFPEQQDGRYTLLIPEDTGKQFRTDE